MRKLIAFNHISLDGFVAGPNGEMNWIKIDPDLFDFVEQRISKGNAAMYGKNTFLLMEGYWHTAAEQPNATKHDVNHSKWYKEIRKIVISKSLNASDYSNTEIINENLIEAIQKIKEEEGPEILVFGSPSATHELLKHDLIDGFWLFLNPVVLGNGIPLFKNVNAKLDLKLVSTHKFDSGVTELNYVVEK